MLIITCSAMGSFVVVNFSFELRKNFSFLNLCLMLVKGPEGFVKNLGSYKVEL